MDLGTFYREFQNPPQLSSLSIDIGAQSMAEDLVRKPPAPPHLVLWPPFLLPWPFPRRGLEISPSCSPTPAPPPCGRRGRRSGPLLLGHHLPASLRCSPRSLSWICVPSFPPFLCSPIPAVLTHSCCLPDVLCSLTPLSRASSAALAISCSACQAGARDTGQKQQKDRVVVFLCFHHSSPCSHVQPDVLILTVMTISPFRVFSISCPQRADECLA